MITFVECWVCDDSSCFKILIDRCLKVGVGVSCVVPGQVGCTDERQKSLQTIADLYFNVDLNNLSKTIEVANIADRYFNFEVNNTLFVLCVSCLVCFTIYQCNYN